jgi:YcxB-like protein
MAQIEFTLDRREVVFIKLRNLFTRSPLVGVEICLLLIAIISIRSHSDVVRSYAVTAAGFFCIIAASSVYFAVKAAWAVPLRPTTLSWDDSSFTLSQDGSKAQIEWRRFSGWSESRKYVFIRLRTGDVSIPKRSLSSEMLADFRTYLQRVEGKHES